MRIILGTVVFFSFLASICYGLEWTGQIQTTDGIIHVSNPSTPIQPPETIELEQLWRIDESNDGTIFGSIKNIVVDDEGTAYILDTQLKEVVVYDANGRFLQTIGREGDGPGEFRYPNNIFITPDRRIGVVQVVPGKIHMFKPNGDPLPDYQLPELSEDGMFYIRTAVWTPGGVVIHRYQCPMTDDGGLIIIYALIAVDEQGIEFAHFHDHRSIRRAPNNKRFEESYGPVPADWSVGPAGRVAVRTKYDDYQLTIHNATGEVDRVVTRSYKSRKRRTEARNALQNYYDELYEGRNWRGNIGPIEYVMHENDADIQELFIRGDGLLWVLTSRGAYDAPHGELGTFDIFDDDGRFIRQVTLLGEGDYWDDDFFVSGDRLFVVTNVGADIPGWERAGEDNADKNRERSVICYKLPQ